MKKEIFGYKSFEDLFNQYFEDLMRFVYGYVGNEEVARDIVHDVFLTFWNHREHLDFSWSLKSYLFTLSRNYALNYLRHQKVVAQNEEALMREMESIQDEWEDYDQKIERLQAGLAALPDKQMRGIDKMFRRRKKVPGDCRRDGYILEYGENSSETCCPFFEGRITRRADLAFYAEI